MSINIVSDALKYYDLNNEKYRDLKKRIKYVKTIDASKEDIEGKILAFYDGDKNKLFTSRVEILGKYYNTINTWIWGWSLPDIDKALTSIIRKVFFYGTDINIDNSANVILKNELVTSRFRVVDDIQIEIHCAIASYLAKKPFIFMWKEFFVTMTDELSEVKGEFYKGNTDVVYYTYIVDPPDIDSK